jgi:2-polyprenyl-3-methyl-5-hydroxy-6-metoxy-1,4-benzoquinol methylase
MSATETVLTTADPTVQRRDALLDRLNEAGTGMMEMCEVYIGERLGLYQALADHGPLTSPELAARTGTTERYVREWLEAQTVAGILETENAEAGPQERRFQLPPGHLEALADRENLNYWAPNARVFVSVVPTLPAVLEAFRTGEGVPFADYGADCREGMADSSKLAYVEMMGTEWIPAMPDLHERLQADPPARVADIGMGAGWTSIAMARAYPKANVDGFDLDPESVELAQRNVAEQGLSGRVKIQLRNAMDPELAGKYDLVTAFFCLHDMSQPVSALRTMRHLAGQDGTVLVVDPKGADRFLDPETNRKVERQYYGFSVLHCLPASMAEQPSAATGTVMRASTMRGYAAEAGFSDVEILPVEDEWSTYYRLRV